jgi:hypothetical protein
VKFTWVAAWSVALQALAALAVSRDTPGRCADHVARQRAAWRVVEPAKPQPPALGGGRVWHWPTDTLGVWVVETEDPVGSGTSLQRVAASGVTDVVWSGECEAATTERPRRPVARPAFTDADLRRSLGAHARGLLYVWSPHMPLSVDGVATIRTAAARLDLPVTVLLDPNADPATAAATIAAHGWSASEGRVVDSVELLFRDVLVHAPSVQAYARGHLVGSPYPGYHSVDEYRAFIDRVLRPSP